MKKFSRFLIVAAIVLFVGWLGMRLVASPREGHAVEPGAVAVAAARVERGTLASKIRLTAEFHPYQEIDVHAKVAGFIKSIPVDIGDRIKQGEVIATLEVPELQEDLIRAQAAVDAANENVKQADAGYQGVHLGFTRLEQVSKDHPKLVAEQELDDMRAKDQAAGAALASARQHVGEAQADQKRQSALVEYSKITAPFDGVVTKRYADVGALIQAGTSSSAPASAVVRFAQENVLRATFPVPESAVSTVQNGAPVRIEISGLRRAIQGSVSRFSRELNPQTRTMEVEVDVPNDDGSITPGMFGWAELTLQEHPDAVNIPVQAVATGENPTVYLIGKKNRIEERPVKVGLETPDRVEIVSGLRPGDLVFVGNRSQVRVGVSVQPTVIEDDRRDVAASKNG